jgi:YvrJ-like protein
MKEFDSVAGVPRDASPTAAGGNIEPPWVGWITKILRDVGFPAFIALYLLLQITPALAELRDAVRELIVTVRGMPR